MSFRSDGWWGLWVGIGMGERWPRDDREVVPSWLFDFISLAVCSFSDQRVHKMSVKAQ